MRRHSPRGSEERIGRQSESSQGLRLQESVHGELLQLDAIGEQGIADRSLPMSWGLEKRGRSLK